MLKIFEDIEKIKEKHPKYLFLKNRYNERKVLEKLVEGFVDRDNDIVFKFQKEFHSSFWEFYLFGLFKELGFEVDFSKNRPDFIIKKPMKINIEAVIANLKNNNSDMEGRTIFDTYPLKLSNLEFKQILDEGIVRNSNALHNKITSFSKNYSKCDWIDKKDPFIIAIGSYDQINYGREFNFSMMALLYGCYATEYALHNKMILKQSIVKPGTDSEIELNLFSKQEYSDISAIIFSCTATIGKLSALHKSEYDYGNSVISIRHDSEYNYYPIHRVSKDNPEEIGDGIFVFHNPNAKIPLDKNIFNKKGIIQVYLENSILKTTGDTLPLISRYNSELSAYSSVLENHTINELFNSYNEDLKMFKGKVLFKDNYVIKILVNNEVFEFDLKQETYLDLINQLKEFYIKDELYLLFQIDLITKEPVSLIKVSKLKENEI